MADKNVQKKADAWSKRNLSAFEGLLNVNQFLPVTGDIQSGILAAQDVRNKDYGSAALNSLGLLPFIPALGGVIAKNIPSKTQFEVAHEIAQKNAALPVSEGGLGLPKNNTAMDRAKAMGFNVDEPMYHGTSKDIEKFDLRGKFRKGGAGYFVTDNPTTASYYAGSFNERFPKDNPNVMQLLINPKNTFDYTNPKHLSKMGEQINKLNNAELVRYGYYYPPENWLDRISTGDWATLENKGMMKALKKSGFDSAKVKEGEQINTMLLNNKNLRSVNAAFDPFRRNEADILAGLLAVPATQLMQPEEKKKKRNTK